MALKRIGGGSIEYVVYRQEKKKVSAWVWVIGGLIILALLASEKKSATAGSPSSAQGSSQQSR